jgi:hypothetical protein
VAARVTIKQPKSSFAAIVLEITASSMANASCKDECEALMSAVLPAAERMLLEQRAFRPFGSTLSADGEIRQVGGWVDAAEPVSAVLVSEFEASFRDGAARGELKATALLESVALVSPGESEPGAAIAIRLDHRDGYSIVVTFPYRFSAAWELVIDEPFAAEGTHGIFPRSV